MNGVTPPPRRRIKFGEAALWGAAMALSRLLAAPAPVRFPAAVVDDSDAAKRRDLLTYAVGYGLALTLTCLAFALVHWRWAEPSWALGLVLALGLVQIIVHFRCFLHIDLRSQARSDLLLVLFSVVIVLLMVGGTLVVLFNLRARMMM